MLANIENIKNRFVQFWNRDNEYALVSVKAYSDKKGWLSFQDQMAMDNRFSNVFYYKTEPSIKIDYQVNKLKYMHYAGETMPVISVEIGPGMSAAFLGAIVDLVKVGEPTWFHPNMEDYHSGINFNPYNTWYILQRNLLQYAVAAATKHHCFTEIPVDIYNGIDSLMLLRGSDQLAMDLVLQPEEVKTACKDIVKLWKLWIDEFFELKYASNKGNSTAWLNLWGPGRSFTMQSDFMTMISSEMYEEFILPDVIEMSKYLDNVMFHFDGPDEVKRHLPFLLDLDTVHGIQWNPKTNCENIRHIPVLKEIQNKGKCLILNAARSEIDTLLSELSPKGLLLNIDPFEEPYDTPEEAEKIVNQIKKYRV